MHRRAAVIASAAAIALPACNAIFGRDVRLADDGGGPTGIVEPCAVPKTACSEDAVPVSGDWDGDGSDSPGLFDAGRWCVTNRRETGSVCIAFLWGVPGDSPIVGDWNGDGVDGPGWYRDTRWSLKDANASGDPAEFGWGNAAIQPISGDWDHQGHDTPGGARDVSGTITWTLSNHNSAGGVDHQFSWGPGGVIRLVGDWDGNGTDTPAWFGNGAWRFSNVNDTSGATGFAWGRAGDVPVVGDWDGDGFDTVGLYRDGMWSLSNQHIADVTAPGGPTDVTAFPWGTQ